MPSVSANVFYRMVNTIWGAVCCCHSEGLWLLGCYRSYCFIIRQHKRVLYMPIVWQTLTLKSVSCWFFIWIFHDDMKIPKWRAIIWTTKWRKRKKKDHHDACMISWKNKNILVLSNLTPKVKIAPLEMIQNKPWKYVSDNEMRWFCSMPTAHSTPTPNNMSNTLEEPLMCCSHCEYILVVLNLKQNVPNLHTITSFAALMNNSGIAIFSSCY